MVLILVLLPLLQHLKLSLMHERMPTYTYVIHVHIYIFIDVKCFPIVSISVTYCVTMRFMHTLYACPYIIGSILISTAKVLFLQNLIWNAFSKVMHH